MTRHRLLLVDDEFWATPLQKLDDVGAIRLPFAGVGALAIEGSVGSSWNVSNYNAEHAAWEHNQPSQSLLDIVVGGHDAVETFAESERPFDVVLLDVDLNKLSPRPVAYAEHFEGLGFFRRMAEFAARNGRADETLFILYTRAPQVLTILQPFLVRSRDELPIILKIVRPLVLEFGKRSSPSEPTDEAGDLLLEILEEHLESRAAARLRASTEFEKTVAVLDTLAASGSDNQRLDIEQITLNGAPLAHLFPFSIGKMRQASSAAERRTLAVTLRRRLTCSFRNRLVEFWRKLATPFGGQPLRHIDLIREHVAVQQAWQFLRRALDELAAGDCHDAFRRDLLLPLQRLVSMEPTAERKAAAANYLGKVRDDAAGHCPITAALLAHRAPQGYTANSVPWLLSRYDHDAIEAVINANALRHGGLESAQTETPCVRDEGIVVHYFTGTAPADAGQVLRALAAPRMQAKLSDLRWIVCSLYDGWLEVASKNGASATVVSVPRAGEPSVAVPACSSVLKEGTTYILHFPLGD